MENTQKVRDMLAQIGGACVQITLGCEDCQHQAFDVDVLAELENSLLDLYKNAKTLRHSASSTIDPALDHDGDTQPGGWPLLEPDLDGLSKRIAGAGEHDGLVVEPAVLAELVRVYRAVLTPAVALDTIGELGAALKNQVEAATLAAEGILRRAGQRFEILLLWSKQHGMETGWHCTQEPRMKWRGTFDEARQIVRDKYGPKRGTEALIVVRVDE